MKAYEQHAGKAVERDERFEHVMAITLDPQTSYGQGVIRCITSRSGDITLKGNTDRSVLHKINGDSLKRFTIGERIAIQDEDKIVASFDAEGLDYLGLEDPDIWRDGETMHIYFTMPYISKDKEDHFSLIHLGHAVGRDLNSLCMTKPVLTAAAGTYANSRAKEVSIAPLNSKGFRYNLFEGHDKLNGIDDTFSVVMVARADDMGAPWKFGPIVFHPGGHNLPWIAGHASPGPLLPRSFIDAGPDKLVGIMNGCEANKHEGGKTIYGKFRAGLFIYDYERGVIDWVSSQHLIEDTEAVRITFASQFVETKPGEGILYAHVDDSFVRAYTLFADGIKALLP